MKRELKGLVSMWLSVILIVTTLFVPGVFAIESQEETSNEKEVMIYHGSELNEGNYADGYSFFYIDLEKTLSEQPKFPININPQEWKVWKFDSNSSGYVFVPSEVNPNPKGENDKISQSEYDSITQEEGMVLFLEPKNIKYVLPVYNIEDITDEVKENALLANTITPLEKIEVTETSEAFPMPNEDLNLTNLKILWGNYNGSGGAYVEDYDDYINSKSEDDSIYKSLKDNAIIDYIYLAGEKVQPSHTYIYLADKNVITETCDCGCEHTETATIKSPTNTIYDGTAKEATVEYSSNWQGGELSVEYSEGGNVNTGRVEATISKDGATALVFYTIRQRQQNSGGDSGVRYYTITFEDEDGKKFDSQRIKRNDTVTKPEDPQKEGFVFEGWYTDEEKTSLYDFDTKVINGFKLYAKWKQDENSNISENTHDSTGCGGGDSCPSAKFKDLDLSKWYHESTDFVIDNKLMMGVSDDLFAPDMPLTRAMFVTVLFRINGSPELKNKSIPFADVKGDEYFADAVMWAQQNSIVMGYDENLFAPNDNLTREQAATMIFRYALYKGLNAITLEENLHFDDAEDISGYAVSAMNWAVGQNILKGKTETTLNPKDNITRSEMAAILHRFILNNK